ncbi:hypothetical protein [Priestia endophytica]|uniref:Uncharacterized protein n=1 Tax=Priestia endophytica TaxID=135735 RepID=A0AAX1Q172_9BACI|nr:hypothetical protein [Priestia endophytica]RAS71725.1 hypothetical protein A3864_21825 [Priestia endophytica]RAS87243.1 hypothetical protein A3863_17465 [Priestia endophytica]
MNSAIANKIVAEVTEEIYTEYPELLQKFGRSGKQKCQEDNEHHLNQLRAAVHHDNVKMFIDYSEWLDGILTSRGMKTDHLTDNFARLIKHFKKQEDKELQKHISFLQEAIETLENK